jgi:HrpA-like RNA helicase
MLVGAREEGCLEEVLVIAAALSVQDPRDRPLEKAAGRRRAPCEIRRTSARTSSAS